MAILLHNAHRTGISEIKWSTHSVLLISAHPLCCSKSPPFACLGRRLLPALRIGSTSIVYLLPREVVKNAGYQKNPFFIIFTLLLYCFPTILWESSSRQWRRNGDFCSWMKMFFLVWNPFQNKYNHIQWFNAHQKNSRKADGKGGRGSTLTVSLTVKYPFSDDFNSKLDVLENGGGKWWESFRHKLCWCRVYYSRWP